MPRVLLIEDNPDQAFVASRYLERAGFAVAHQPTGALGLESARTGGFDLVMLDYALPDTDGLTLLDQLLPLGAPVVLVTGRSEAQLAVRALQAGAANYIVKDSHYLSKLPDIARETLERISAAPLTLEPRRSASGAIQTEEETLERFRQIVRKALEPMLPLFRQRIGSNNFADAVDELERVLEATETVLDEELEVLDQLLYEELSRTLSLEDRRKAAALR
jgi:DNA-binding response OmpR family regulator